MTASPNPTDQLAQECDTARELMAVLKEEQNHLTKANIDELGSLIARKSALVTRMAELSKTRLKALAQVGFAAEEASMQKWLDSSSAIVPNKDVIQKTWNELRALVRASKELNRTNGLLISTHMSHNQVALQVLQGDQDGQVYGRNGQTSVQTSRRSLVVG